jgi:hypothetical protein
MMSEPKLQHSDWEKRGLSKEAIKLNVAFCIRKGSAMGKRKRKRYSKRKRHGRRNTIGTITNTNTTNTNIDVSIHPPKRVYRVVASDVRFEVWNQRELNGLRKRDTLKRLVDHSAGRINYEVWDYSFPTGLGAVTSKHQHLLHGA